MKKKIIVLIVAIFCTIGFCFGFTIYKSFQIQNKRLSIISIIVSFIFSIFEIIGKSIVNYGDLFGIFENYNTILKNFIKFSSIWIMLYIVKNIN